MVFVCGGENTSPGRRVGVVMSDLWVMLMVSLVDATELVAVVGVACSACCSVCGDNRMVLVSVGLNIIGPSRWGRGSD